MSMNRTFLILLGIGNFLGTIYGYIWYADQLRETPWYFLIFVPDSPTASLFFTAAVFMHVYRGYFSEKSRALVSAIGHAASIKYGIWANAMILFAYFKGSTITWLDVMLMVSHIIMAVEALWYAPRFALSQTALFIAGGWLLLNDAMDYTFGVFPRLSETLHPYLPGICIFTVLLSLCSVYVLKPSPSTSCAS